MRVQVPFRMVASVGRLLMKAHSVRERGFEEVVVSRGDALEDVSQRVAAGIVVSGEVCYVISAAKQNFEWPNRPERNQNDEMLVFADNSLSHRALEFNVVAK